jgi:arylsulfatase A-like enzyme
VNGVLQEPLHGVSMMYSFDDAKAAERHETQYFEMFCNRGIYHKGWTAVTRHGNVPWIMTGAQPPLSEDAWELYDTSKDWTQAHDLAKEQPDRLRDLQMLFALEGEQVQRLPPRRSQGRVRQPRSRGPPGRGARIDAEAVSGRAAHPGEYCH